MNQPTREELQEIKKRLEKLEQQQTEPIQITRLEIDTGSMHKRLDTIEENTNITKIQMEGARADIRVVKANQSDLLGYLENHSQRLESIEQKQEAHSDVLGQLLNIGEELKSTQGEHSQRFNRLESTMSTKVDIDRLESTMATKIDIDRLEGIIMQVLSRLPKAERE